MSQRRTLNTPDDFHEATRQFRRAFLVHHLAVGESIIKTARRIGVQRTYLIRLKREFDIEGPRSWPVRSPATDPQLLPMSDGRVQGEPS